MRAGPRTWTAKASSSSSSERVANSLPLLTYARVVDEEVDGACTHRVHQLVQIHVDDIAQHLDHGVHPLEHRGSVSRDGEDVPVVRRKHPGHFEAESP